jgi:arabinose-5-phosphate isomerase
MPSNARPNPTISHFEQLRYAQEIIQIESHALANLAKRLDADFCHAVDLLFRCNGSVIVTGMGKAGLIAQKVAATLSSTGTRAHYLHPAEAVHGDLGRIHATDLVLVLSQSGETEEVTRLLPSIGLLGAPLIAMTGRRQSTLGRAATVVIDLGPMQEACSLGLAPSTSTTAMLAMGDALALVLSRMRNFQPEDFARFHPAGSLGRKLSKVQDHMRPLRECRIAECNDSVRDVLVALRSTGRRTGAVMIVDEQGILTGLFTDSDLARLLEARRDEAIDQPIQRVMTKNPTAVPLGSMMVDAVAMLAERKISELPVVDANNRPQGLIDVTDIVSLLPDPRRTESLSAQSPTSVPPPKHPLLRAPTSPVNLPASSPSSELT